MYSIIKEGMARLINYGLDLTQETLAVFSNADWGIWYIYVNIS